MRVPLLLSGFMAMLASLILVATASAASPIEAGKSYMPLKSSVVDETAVLSLREESSGAVQVIEFFSYGCRWCASIEEEAQAWASRLSNDVDFVRQPVVFQPGWRPLAKAFYTAQGMDLLDGALHAALFDATQKERGGLNSDEKVRDFFMARSVDPDAFDKMYHSFSVNVQLERANALLRAFEVMYIPVFVVNGPREAYLVSVDTAGTESDVFEVLDYLIEKVQKEQLGRMA